MCKLIRIFLLSALVLSCQKPLFETPPRSEPSGNGSRRDSIGILDPDAPEPVRPRPMLALRIGDRVLYANPEDNESARALIEALSEEPLTLTLRDYGGFEKVGELPWELPRCDETLTTVPGDLILYQGTQLSIYYDENTWSLTRLAKVYGVDRAGLLELLGPEDAEVELWVEWSE